MPELPEVETIVRDLRKEITGLKIKEVNVEKNYNVISDKNKFKNSLLNHKISDVLRIAKNIVIKIDSANTYLVFHLAMTGRMLFQNVNEKKETHLKVEVVFENEKAIRFSDVRMFGSVRILNQEGIEKLQKKYGPSPLNKNLTPEAFHNAITKKKTIIKKALLDQEIVSGLGNIYANDSLFIAGIHPETSTKTLTLKDSKKLLESAKIILLEGITNRGSTLSDLMYVDIYGKTGLQQNNFRVYGNTGKACKKCGTKVEMKVIAGRSSFFCPNCQKIKTPTLF